MENYQDRIQELLDELKFANISGYSKELRALFNYIRNEKKNGALTNQKITARKEFANTVKKLDSNILSTYAEVLIDYIKNQDPEKIRTDKELRLGINKIFNNEIKETYNKNEIDQSFFSKLKKGTEYKDEIGKASFIYFLLLLEKALETIDLDNLISESLSSESNSPKPQNTSHNKPIRSLSNRWKISFAVAIILAFILGYFSQCPQNGKPKNNPRPIVIEEQKDSIGFTKSVISFFNYLNEGIEYKDKDPLISKNHFERAFNLLSDNYKIRKAEEWKLDTFRLKNFRAGYDNSGLHLSIRDIPFSAGPDSKTTEDKVIIMFTLRELYPAKSDDVKDYFNLKELTLNDVTSNNGERINNAKEKIIQDLDKYYHLNTGNKDSLEFFIENSPLLKINYPNYYYIIDYVFNHIKKIPFNPKFDFIRNGRNNNVVPRYVLRVQEVFPDKNGKIDSFNTLLIHGE